MVESNDRVSVCMSPPPALSCLSPNPIEMNSAAKLNEFGNQVTNLQQKIDLIVAKSATESQPSLRTPPPIEETGDVEKDFETVFEFNNNSTHNVAPMKSTAEIELRVKSPPPPPLPMTAPPPPVSAKPPRPVIQKQVSINTLNSLKPWQKQHEYRPMSMVLKDKQEDHPHPAPLANISFNFKPIGAVASSEEDVRKGNKASILSPTPIYSSMSVQNLLDVRKSQKEEEEQAAIHGSLDNLFKSKSSDDLVMPDIDGIQGIRSNKYKKIRHGLRSSASHEEIAKEPKQEEGEEDIYENLDKIREEVKNLKLEAADLDRKKAEMEVFIRPVVKKPKPLPRVNSETELNRSAKTLSFVFDPKANEFVLEPERVSVMPNMDNMIERNSLLLQQRSSSTSNIVPIHVSSPRKSTPGMNVKSLDSLDFARDPVPEPTNTLNEKGNFFNFRFFGKVQKEKPAQEEPQRQSVFYSEPVDLISVDEHKYEAKLVHIDDDEEGEDEGSAVVDQNHYEVVTVNETFNRTMATFSQQQQSVVSRGGSRKFEYVMQVIGSLLNYSASVTVSVSNWASRQNSCTYCEWFCVVLYFVDAFIIIFFVSQSDSCVINVPVGISIVSVAPTDTTQQSLLSTVQQEITVRRQKTGITRQDSRLSVKSLIESIENAQKHAKINQDSVDSHCSSTSSINSLSSDNHHHHHHHRHTVDPNNMGDVVDNGEFCYEKNPQLISFSRSQSHHGTTDWIESGGGGGNNNINNNDYNNGSSNNQVRQRERGVGGNE